MKARNILFALAAAGAAIASTSLAVAPAAASEIGGLAVRHADLNLASPSGRAALDRRIAFAADRLCGDAWTDILVMQRLARTCQDGVIAAAGPQRAALLRGDRLAALVLRRAEG